MPLVVAILLWVGLQVVHTSLASETGSNVSFGAHLGGFAAGLLLAGGCSGGPAGETAGAAATDRVADEELLRLVHAVAQARAKSASKMDVPKVIAHAHPHLLLVLENSERAYQAALDGNHQRFVEQSLRALGASR